MNGSKMVFTGILQVCCVLFLGLVVSCRQSSPQAAVPPESYWREHPLVIVDERGKYTPLDRNPVIELSAKKALLIPVLKKRGSQVVSSKVLVDPVVVDLPGDSLLSVAKPLEKEGWMVDRLLILSPGNVPYTLNPYFFDLSPYKGRMVYVVKAAPIDAEMSRKANEMMKEELSRDKIVVVLCNGDGMPFDQALKTTSLLSYSDVLSPHVSPTSHYSNREIRPAKIVWAMGSGAILEVGMSAQGKELLNKWLDTDGAAFEKRE